MWIHAFSGAIRSFTHAQYNADDDDDNDDDDRTYFSNVVVVVVVVISAGGWFSSLSNISVRARTWMRRCGVCCGGGSAHIVTHTHTHTRAADASRRYLSSLLLQQMPVATRPGRRCHVFGFVPRISACFCLPLSLPLSYRPISLRPLSFPFTVSHSLSRFLVLPRPATLLTEKRFSPFLPRDRALTLSRRGSGVESTRRSDDEATALPSPLIFFLRLCLCHSVPLSPSLFFLTEDNTFEPTKR